jgi:hypothetical protein
MSTILEAPVRRVSTRPPEAVSAWHSNQWAWLGAGLAFAFLIPYLFADLLGVPRDGYYAIYVVSVLTFTALWLRGTGQDARAVLRRNWRWGVALGLLTVAATAGLVFATGSTSGPGAWTLAGAILWRGVIYGAVDGLLLSVIPILGVFAAFDGRPLRERSRRAVAAIGALAMAFSLAFTAVYHLGYPDFRGNKVTKPMRGDLVWSLPTLVTLSPLGAPIAHAGMHVTAVVHAYHTDLFLPPHAAQRSS